MKKTNKKPRHSVAHSRAHIRKLHRARVGLFSLLLLALVAVRGDSGVLQAAPESRSSGAVLAYSTSMSRSDLLSATNTFRAQNGRAPLALNSQLNTSAQNKAQHMVDLDYWAHNAPDGTTPWYFFDQAGYDYSKAGENLAYGFDTSQDAINGWAGSPGHRDNMLGEYNDVGFGIVDGATYQGGPNTAVVAHYGVVAGSTAPAPALVAPAATSVPAAPAIPAPTPAPTAPVEAEQPTQETPPLQPKQTAKPTKPAPTPAVAVAATRNVTILDQFSTGQPHFAAAISALLVVGVVIGFMLTHRSFVRHATIVGEQFVIAHPLADSTAVVAMIVLMLSTTIGRIG